MTTNTVGAWGQSMLFNPAYTGQSFNSLVGNLQQAELLFASGLSSSPMAQDLYRRSLLGGVGLPAGMGSPLPGFNALTLLAQALQGGGVSSGFNGVTPTFSNPTEAAPVKSNGPNFLKQQVFGQVNSFNQ
jgi:hypothetical protein